MPEKNRRVIYWDSCVFLSYLDETPDRIKILSDVIEEIEQNDNSIILTSSDSMVEVAFVSKEWDEKQLDSSTVSIIDGLWNDTNLIKIIDNGPHIALSARQLIRDGLVDGKSLKPKDAIHLATAQWYNKTIDKVDEFQTYDKKLLNYGLHIGIHTVEPHVIQHKMNLEIKNKTN